MSGIIGKKIGMTSIYDNNGKNIPCTIIEAGPCVVTQIKTKETDGYNSIQLAYGERSEKNISKSKLNHFRKAKTSPKTKLHEFKNYEHDYKLGDKINVDHFIEGEFVDVSGISKGKGFQGVVKRHGFAGVGQATHGQHNRLRAPGSIGAASYPARVFLGDLSVGILLIDVISSPIHRPVSLAGDPCIIDLMKNLSFPSRFTICRNNPR
mgnify:CR=1 FL=1